MGKQQCHGCRLHLVSGDSCRKVSHSHPSLLLKWKEKNCKEIPEDFLVSILLFPLQKHRDLKKKCCLTKILFNEKHFFFHFEFHFENALLLCILLRMLMRFTSMLLFMRPQASAKSGCLVLMYASSMATKLWTCRGNQWRWEKQIWS